MPEADNSPAPDPVPEISEIVADILGVDTSEIATGVPLTTLGLESFTAVRLRRRIRDDLGIDLPLTGFLGDATVTTVARGLADPDGRGEAADTTTPPGGAGLGSATTEGFPLTPLQTAYWIGRDPAFPLGGVATFYYREYDRYGVDTPEADLEALNAAWNRIVEHHPMLRMVVGRDGRQRVLDAPGEYRIGVTDLRAATPESADRALAELRHARSHQLRPTDHWPLFDIHAAFLPDGRTRLLIGVDVLSLDLAGWMQVLAEWGTLVADPEAELPTSSVTFAELVQQRRDDPERQRQRERDMAYWRERAPTLPPGPDLPWERDLAGIGPHRCSRHEQRLAPHEWRRLRSRAAEHGLSPTGVLLAAFGLTLARWGATDPFSLTTTLFDRPDIPETRHLVGDFTSTVLVETPQPRLSEWGGFLDYATRVNRRFWTDLEHRSVSGVEVLRDANGAPSLTPTHPVVFTSGLGLTDPDSTPTDWLGEEVFGVSQTPQVALDHIVHEENGQLRVCWDHVDGVLPPEFVAGMANAHARLIRRLAAEPDTWTDPALGWDPAFLPDEPLDCLPFGDAGPLLDDPLRAIAPERPEASALITPTGTVTHGELAGRVRRTASQLAATGVGPGDLVAVSLEKGADQVAALAGIMSSGAGYVPVEPAWPAGRVATLCEQAGITRAVVAAGSTTEWPDTVTVREIDSTGALSPEPATDGPAEPRRPSDDDLAYVIFTSGSTGRPKGVAIQHRAARTTIDDLIDRFPVAPGDRMLALSTFSFDLSVHDIFGVMGTGAALVLPDATRQRDPGHWLELMDRHRVTLWNSAPALLEMLVEYAEVEPETARTALSHLRLVFLSADWIPVTLPDRIRALAPNAQVVSLGGATEASIWSICHPIGEVDPDWPSIPYGRALRGQSFHVIDPDSGAPLPVGEPGELHIGGGGLARGYIGDPAQTAERFVEHPVLGRLYRTGDLGRWRPDGTIEFLGRLDRQVKIRGHRIELGEVESALDRLPGVRQAVAMSMRGPDDRPRLVAFLTAGEEEPAPSDDQLITQLRERVPDFMVPSRFVRLRDLPVTDNGKIDYRALTNPYQRAPETAAEGSSGPATEQPGHPDDNGPGTEPSREQPPAPTPDHATAPPGSPGDTDTLLAAALDAIAEGLSVSLRVGPGDLPPSRALGAAGSLASRLESLALPGTVRASQRLCRDGLVEVTLHAGNGASPAGDAGTAATSDTPPASVPSATPSPSPAGARPAPAPSAPEPAPGDAPERRQRYALDVEHTVVRVFAELLETSVDPDTVFFRMGATSLTLVLAHRRLAEEVDPDLSVVDLFSHPTARQVARHIAARREGARPPAPDDGATTAAAEPVAPTAPGSVPGNGSATEPAAAPADRAAARRRARANAREIAG
ncbi:non-ribosomal peptide synthetase [Halostreptopolyspora alba]|uniref:Phenyloxazoline synthase MbtB n=1 Tax=Halostreptopolyspora alba TaxID=2487137 RepID=A0A3N0E5C1_9ACTN|nr:amino acid adenylation domain-containing protein [Nocardiopsaceae bacterium YIM 96095]